MIPSKTDRTTCDKPSSFSTMDFKLSLDAIFNRKASVLFRICQTCFELITCMCEMLWFSTIQFDTYLSCDRFFICNSYSNIPHKKTVVTYNTHIKFIFHESRLLYM